VNDNEPKMSGGYTMRVAHEGERVVVGMTTFDTAEATKLARRIVEEIAMIEAARQVPGVYGRAELASLLSVRARRLNLRPATPDHIDDIVYRLETGDRATASATFETNGGFRYTVRPAQGYGMLDVTMNDQG
jgi:hypothetical protein